MNDGIVHKYARKPGSVVTKFVKYTVSCCVESSLKIRTFVIIIVRASDLVSTARRAMVSQFDG